MTKLTKVGIGRMTEHPVSEMFPLGQDGRGSDGVQSLCFIGRRTFVLCNGSRIELYDDGVFASQRTVAGGEVSHPNDSTVHDGLILVCDTGPYHSAVTRVDPDRLSVIDSRIVANEGSKLAAIDVSPSGIWTAWVQRRPLTERKGVRIAALGADLFETGQAFIIPTERYYVQGCTVIGDTLYLGMNDGATTRSDILIIDLHTGSVTDTVVLEPFGESEGLSHLHRDGSIFLTTALTSGVFSIELGIQ